jgi:hypothetical protein
LCGSAKRRSAGRAAAGFICLHPTAAYQLNILKEISERFLFVNGGVAEEYPDYPALMSQAGVRRYLGALAP